MGSSQTRARTRVPCIGRRILNHCTTREALFSFFSFFFNFHRHSWSTHNVSSTILDLRDKTIYKQETRTSDKIIPAEITIDCAEVPVGIRRRNESNRRYFGGLDLELGFYESKHELGKTNPAREGASTNTKN